MATLISFYNNGHAIGLRTPQSNPAQIVSSHLISVFFLFCKDKYNTAADDGSTEIIQILLSYNSLK